MNVKSYALPLLFILCGGCSIAQPHRPSPVHDWGYGVGYVDKPIGDSRYKVEIRAYRNIDEPTLVSALKERARELCGGERFDVYNIDFLELRNEGTMSRLAPEQMLEGYVECM